MRRFLEWLRVAICVHGPYEFDRKTFPYDVDRCARCKKVLIRYCAE